MWILGIVARLSKSARPARPNFKITRMALSKVLSNFEWVVEKLFQQLLELFLNNYSVVYINVSLKWHMSFPFKFGRLEHTLCCCNCYSFSKIVQKAHFKLETTHFSVIRDKIEILALWVPSPISKVDFISSPNSNPRQKLATLGPCCYHIDDSYYKLIS